MTAHPSNRRVALVTGSTSGIGRAIAQRLAKDGFAIAFHSRASVMAGKALIEAHPGSSYTQADLADSAQVQYLATRVLSNHGRLDVLVNNAGLSATIPHADFQAATPEIWRSLYEVNVIAPWTLITALEAALRRAASPTGPSCILNISSHAGIRPKGASIPYATSKAALTHMTKLLALNLAPSIRVNAIAPGLVNTPMSQHWAAARELWQTRSPMGRGAEPEEIADVASMLVANRYITGEIVMADGGLNLT